MDIVQKNKKRSEDANIFITHRPSYIERNGIQIIVFIFILLFSATWFVKYPDKITETAYLSAENAPKEIKPKTEGILHKLFVQNGSDVKKGDIIGWIEAESNYQDVLELLSDIKKIEQYFQTDKNIIEKNKLISNASKFNSGDLQKSYAEFISALLKYDDFHLNGFYDQKIKFTNHEIDVVKKRSTVLKTQTDLTKKDLAISQELYNTDNTLEKNNLVTKEDLKLSESQLINKEKSYYDLSLAMINIESSISEKKSEILQLEHDISQNQIQFSQAIQMLKTTLLGWIDKYSIKSSTNGQIEFSSFIQENQFISLSKPFGYIIPAHSKYYMRTSLSQDIVGKLEKNTPVEIRFNAYPYKDFGVLEGRLTRISEIALDSGFLSKIDLVNGLETNLHYKVPYRENLKSDAIFVTKDLRLLERFFNSLVRSPK